MAKCCIDIEIITLCGRKLCILMQYIVMVHIARTGLWTRMAIEWHKTSKSHTSPRFTVHELFLGNVIA